MAERRLQFLKKRLDKDPKLLTNYSNYIEDLVVKGYARKIPEAQLKPEDGNIWYLPQRYFSERRAFTGAEFNKHVDGRLDKILTRSCGIHG